MYVEITISLFPTVYLPSKISYRQINFLSRFCWTFASFAKFAGFRDKTEGMKEFYVLPRTWYFITLLHYIVWTFGSIKHYDPVITKYSMDNEVFAKLEFCLWNKLVFLLNIHMSQLSKCILGNGMEIFSIFFLFYLKQKKTRFKTNIFLQGNNVTVDSIKFLIDLW